MTADDLRAFALVAHELAAERDQALAELAEERKLSAALGLDNRALADRLKERDATIERLERGQADSDTLVRRLRDPGTGSSASARAHTGPPGRCQCGVVHGHDQAIAMTARPAGVRDRIEKNT